MRVHGELLWVPNANPVVPLAVGLVAAVTAWAAARRRSGTVLAIWLAGHLSNLWLPVLPSRLDPAFARALVAVTVGLLVGAASREVRAAVGTVATDHQHHPDTGTGP